MVGSEQAALEPRTDPRAQPVEVTVPAAAPTVSERLRDLAGLHQEGIRSEDEFAAAKAKILGGL